MNIIIVNDYAYVNGGAGQVAINTAKLLTMHGDNVVLFSAVGPIEDELKHIDNLNVICLKQHDILNDPSRIRAIVQGIWNFRAKNEFENLLKKFDPKNTVIHIHTLSKAISSSILPTAKSMGFKTLYHLHDYGIACPNLGFYDFQENCICHRSALSLRCLAKHCDSRSYLHKCWRVIRQFVQEYIGGLPSNIDCLIYISKFSLNVLRPYLRDYQCLEFLPNYVGVSHQPRIQAENNKTIIYVGRLSPEKNPHILAKATKELGITVMFIGSGVCEKEVIELNLTAIMTGWVSPQEMERLVQSARLLVFPSKWYETQGLSVIEAIARGIPVIVADECAARDEIDDGKNGVLFKNDDIVDLKSKINMFDDQLVKEMSEYGYNTYWNRHTSDVEYMGRLKEIYQKLLLKVR